MSTRKFVSSTALILFMTAFAIMPSAAGVQIRVFAASSLSEAYTALGKSYETKHPGVKIVYSFLGSPTLATQIKSGAPADIFVSASPEDMKGIAAGRNYMTNQIVLGVPIHSKIKTFLDLNRSVSWIQCAHEVPCGIATDAALVGEGVTSKPVSLELRVSSAVQKVNSHEVDAAFIYKTDVRANPTQLRAINPRDKSAATTQYQIAQLNKNRYVTQYFRYLTSRSTLALLHAKGFE